MMFPRYRTHLPRQVNPPKSRGWGTLRAFEIAVLSGGIYQGKFAGSEVAVCGRVTESAFCEVKARLAGAFCRRFFQRVHRAEQSNRSHAALP